MARIRIENKEPSASYIFVTSLLPRYALQSIMRCHINSEAVWFIYLYYTNLLIYNKHDFIYYTCKFLSGKSGMKKLYFSSRYHKQFR